MNSINTGGPAFPVTLKKATPGPWRIGTPPPNGLQTIGTQGGLMVAVATTGLGMPTLENALLIAAAPEMLEMLKECRAALASVFVSGVPEGMVDRVNALIQKAEGND